jgi:hypothetical protein
MKPSWALVVRKEDSLGASVLFGAKTFVLAEGERLWIKGPSLGSPFEEKLRLVPAIERWETAADGQLTAVGSRVPSARLPEGTWLPLEEWFRLSPQPAAFAGRMGAKAKLRLERGEPPKTLGVDTAPQAILAGVESWGRYADRASSVRLEPLVFALNNGGVALVVGRPLPALPGRRCFVAGRVFVPCGFHWRPAVETETLREALGLAKDESALLDPDGSYQRIRDDQFVAATRSAVRLSLRNSDE